MLIMKKLIVGMSGGVDSSVAALLMKNEGYICVGATMQLYIEGDCSDAKAVADKLNMPFYIYPLKEEFKKLVIDKFIEFYENGKTPNPCVECNRTLKFGAMMEKMQELEADFVVTGHYARVVFEDGEYKLKKAVDESKDQSYFLYMLTQEQLKHIKFPLGEYTKPENRQIVLSALRKIGRTDLIGTGPNCLVNAPSPAQRPQPKGKPHQKGKKPPRSKGKR